uniref:Uncharacterized protein n=1 Tax=Arundo donax TaxID=35708 RepID=A0A0A8Z299_ARUDO
MESIQVYRTSSISSITQQLKEESTTSCLSSWLVRMFPST